MGNCKISVCIPCYNTEKYIKQLFKCLESQTFKDFEVVFINDGSTDNTLKLINEYKNKSPLKSKMRVFSQKNLGVAETRNNLIKKSHGEYIFFLDDDDTIPNNALESLYSNSNNGQIDIVVGRAKVIFQNKIKMPFFVQYRFTKNMTSRHYVKSNLCTAWGAILKKEMFNNDYFLKGFSYEDIGLINYLYLKSKNFKSIKNIVYYYRRREYSLSDFIYENRMKIIDLYEQTNYVFKKYQMNNMLESKANLRIINGTLFQILVVISWLSKYYTNNKYINKLPKVLINNLFKEYNLKLHFSKTFWKSLAFFYLKFSYYFINTISYQNKPTNILKKLKIVDSTKLKNKKNTIFFIDKNFDQSVVLKNKKVVFLTYNLNKINKYSNVFGCKKINKITNEIVKLNTNKNIIFLDMRNIKMLNNNDKKIVSKLSTRLVLIFSKNVKGISNKNNVNYIFA